MRPSKKACEAEREALVAVQTVAEAEQENVAHLNDAFILVVRLLIEVVEALLDSRANFVSKMGIQEITVLGVIFVLYYESR